MKHYKKGYTQGVYDMFHIGHLNLIRGAKVHCDELVVGINANELVESYKHKTPVVDESNRREIVANIKGVDEAVIVHTLNKVELQKLIGFDAIFIGDDWRGSDRWTQTENDLAELGVDVVYLPYTKGVSSTQLRPEHPNAVEE